jgi:hypothetical protein
MILLLKLCFSSLYVIRDFGAALEPILMIIFWCYLHLVVARQASQFIADPLWKFYHAVATYLLFFQNTRSTHTTEMVFVRWHSWTITILYEVHFLFWIRYQPLFQMFPSCQCIWFSSPYQLRIRSRAPLFIVLSQKVVNSEQGVSSY